VLERTVPRLAGSGFGTEVIVVNNDPGQDVAAWAAALGEPRPAVVEMGRNAGFSAAVNAGIRASRGAFVLVANSDLFLTDSYIPSMVAFFESHARAGCASGKILRYDLRRDVPSDTIDTAGLAMGRNRRPVDRGEGLPDDGGFELEEQVFAASGAAFFARRSALESVAVDGELFDETFFMYREDVDLSWRLRLAGWECWYVPTAVAHHGRSSRGLGTKSYLRAIRDFHRGEKTKPQVARVHSMKNQWLMLVKNEDWSNLRADLPQVLARELMVLGYNAAFAPRTLVSIPLFARALRPALRKRRLIKSRQAVPSGELRRWFVADGGPGYDGVQARIPPQPNGQ
jgi:GT2 family glycosyltransferase